jgi:hypothetical protein
MPPMPALPTAFPAESNIACRFFLLIAKRSATSLNVREVVQQNHVQTLYKILFPILGAFFIVLGIVGAYLKRRWGRTQTSRTIITNVRTQASMNSGSIAFSIVVSTNTSLRANSDVVEPQATRDDSGERRASGI